MKSITGNYKTNVGLADRNVRYILGLSLTTFPFFYGDLYLDLGYVILITFVALPLIASATIRWDPVYSIFRIGTYEKTGWSNRNFNINMTKQDAVFRYLMGSAIIVGVILKTPAEASFLVVAALIAIPVIITAILRWDPVYSMLDYSSVKTYNKTSAQIAHGQFFYGRNY